MSNGLEDNSRPKYTQREIEAEKKAFNGIVVDIFTKRFDRFASGNVDMIDLTALNYAYSDTGLLGFASTRGIPVAVSEASLTRQFLGVISPLFLYDTPDFENYSIKPQPKTSELKRFIDENPEGFVRVSQTAWELDIPGLDPEQGNMVIAKRFSDPHTLVPISWVWTAVRFGTYENMPTVSGGRKNPIRVKLPSSTRELVLQ